MKRIPHLSIHLAVLAALSGVAHAADDDNANGGELTTVTVTARYETEDAHGDVQYAFETTVGTITPRLDLSYQSKQDWDPASGSRAALPQYTQPGYTVANAQLEYMPHDSKWTATARCHEPHGQVLLLRALQRSADQHREQRGAPA